MNALTHMGYVGIFDYDPGDEAFHGRVMGMRDTIHFCGKSIDDLKKSLAVGVEDYLALCAEDGVQPEKPYSGKIGLRLNADLHRLAATVAKAEGKSLNTWIMETIERQAKASLSA
ncbi:toxin-antitoxin system HicB family antitoxin [Desulfovibrio aerotolerans]|uniref:Toxin-antitoxin system HicB family antitoxin n=2 Tax=Solidesulfovibrio aerotolerans TaxID=295255 RepID=A0A7C9MI33_9BACT|nr:toxin-antitoxin system HicB family antitoxin [Solidesulfovibrio aerotolerans]